MASAGGYLSYENIADKATVAGVEVETRKNLFVRPVSNAAHGMNKLSLGLNGSYIYTNAKINSRFRVRFSVPDTVGMNL